MIPLALMRIASRQTRYTNGVAAPENGVENCGLKNVETAGPMMAADMITAPVRPTALRRRPFFGASVFSVSSVVMEPLLVLSEQTRPGRPLVRVPLRARHDRPMMSSDV